MSSMSPTAEKLQSRSLPLQDALDRPPTVHDTGASNTEEQYDSTPTILACPHAYQTRQERAAPGPRSMNTTPTSHPYCLAYHRVDLHESFCSNPICPIPSHPVYSLIRIFERFFHSTQSVTASRPIYPARSYSSSLLARRYRQYIKSFKGLACAGVSTFHFFFDRSRGVRGCVYLVTFVCLGLERKIRIGAA
ncbi:hypothetical protein BDU57DRAFT_9227 [Ampelomyces quisqualis]|uniref:Uncharacterized protein n=1 Tax=Ampelomyces quisqualis TaxID=50730 RepID=A0A6A5R0C6_AMPQU|nr:hypothetical protein BDU57DRAFT_9227 [Ampelomyces quisqualis]